MDYDPPRDTSYHWRARLSPRAALFLEAAERDEARRSSQTEWRSLVDDTLFDHLLRSLTDRATRRRLLGVLTGLTGVCFGEAAARRGDSRHRVGASRKSEKVAICHRAGNGTYHRIEVAKSAVQKHLDKHRDFRFIDCCADGECKDGETCEAGTCTSVCAADGTTCAGDDSCCSGTCACGLTTCTCAVPCLGDDGADDSLCQSNRCGCPTSGTPGICACRAERCVAPGETCDTNFDCCDGTCVCITDHCTCDCITPDECASGHCACSNVNDFDVCTCRPQGCAATGGTCAVDGDCCNGPCICTGGDCACTCVANGEACASNGACCSGQCAEGTCRDAACGTQLCQTDADCCKGACAGGVCIDAGCAGRCRG